MYTPLRPPRRSCPPGLSRMTVTLVYHARPEEVLITVVHEIAHHFGIEEDRLHELGWG